MTKQEAEKDIRRVTRTCRGKTVMPLAYYRLFNRPVQYQENCGYDVNELIVASFPFDGRDVEVPCPQCGETAIFSTKYDTE